MSDGLHRVVMGARAYSQSTKANNVSAEEAPVNYVPLDK